MKASSDAGRLSRYKPDRSKRKAVLAPSDLRLALVIAHLGATTIPQLSAMTMLHPKAVQRTARRLFDAGIVDVLAVPRAALAPPGGNDPSLAYGSAPNVLSATKAGLHMLTGEGLLDEPLPIPEFGTTSSLALRHRLMIGDCRVWMTRSVRRHGAYIQAWKEGKAAEVVLSTNPTRTLRPDAVAALRLAQDKVLVCLVEADRGTERGLTRWLEKLAAYGEAFDRGHIAEATGYRNARITVFTQTPIRRDRLCGVVAEHAPKGIKDRIWIVDLPSLSGCDFAAAAWIRPPSPSPLPLLPDSVLGRTVMV